MRKLFFIAAILLTGQSIPAQASTCLPATFDEAFEEANIIFSGTADKVSYLDKPDNYADNALCGSKIVTFKISKVWKGDLQEKIDVFAADGCLMLGSYFEEGEDYLVYAYPKNSERPWKGRDRGHDYETGACIRTGPLQDAQAQEDIKLLELKQNNAPSNAPKPQ